MCSYLWGYFPRPSQESESLPKSRVCAESLWKMFWLKSTILERESGILHEVGWLVMGSGGENKEGGVKGAAQRRCWVQNNLGSPLVLPPYPPCPQRAGKGPR